ncbi:methylated-DNA--[protein]-cysteine S-methyltransferase [Bradyrhizobium prioriisuperbiae]|uniref:methylated-DNA--[protein]-cysteine S-methyltransferase n=1 Tax=Bradyrhizobium prioriisuperbiae TaxID=2854389 RepID=UPI0028F0CCB5|nr:methylated-DNA--[protein]-cysteine S-methyltransferase [Bradyrhizobium prioritasuperba]
MGQMLKDDTFAKIDLEFATGACALGTLLVATSDKGICAILLGDKPTEMVKELQRRFPHANPMRGGKACDALLARVTRFVQSPDQKLDLPLDIQGTAFQRRVWQALRKIPAGRTQSYADVARRIGSPAAVRAVAGACAANPIALAIPCHRVVRSDGSLSGYRWGSERKRRLLQREAAI